MSCEHEWSMGLDGGVACRKCQRCAPTLLDTLSDLARVTAERDECHVQLSLVSGALIDAGDVVVEPYDAAVRELTRQRDGARGLADQYFGEWQRAREVVEAARLVAYNGSGWGLLQPALDAYDAGRAKP